MGTSGAGGTLSFSARAFGVTASGMRSPRSSARTCVTMRRMRGAGASNGVSCRPSASWGVLAPRPSTKRPPEIAWSVAAAIAIVAALRFQMPRIPVPMARRLVRIAASASSTVMSYAQVSGMKKPSYPRRSASVARPMMTSRRFSSGMTETPIRGRMRYSPARTDPTRGARAQSIHGLSSLCSSW